MSTAFKNSSGYKKIPGSVANASDVPPAMATDLTVDRNVPRPLRSDFGCRHHTNETALSQWSQASGTRRGVHGEAKRNLFRAEKDGLKRSLGDCFRGSAGVIGTAVASGHPPRTKW